MANNSAVINYDCKEREKGSFLKLAARFWYSDAE